MIIMLEDEEVKYRKKKQHRPPKKSKHKHDYQPCMLRAPVPSFDKVHGMVPIYKLVKASYCTICGKIEDYDFVNLIIETGIKEEEILTLPTFTVKDLFLAKYVNLGE